MILTILTLSNLPPSETMKDVDYEANSRDLRQPIEGNPTYTTIGHGQHRILCLYNVILDLDLWLINIMLQPLSPPIARRSGAICRRPSTKPAMHTIHSLTTRLHWRRSSTLLLLHIHCDCFEAVFQTLHVTVCAFLKFKCIRNDLDRPTLLFGIASLLEAHCEIPRILAVDAEGVHGTSWVRLDIS